MCSEAKCERNEVVCPGRVAIQLVRFQVLLDHLTFEVLAVEPAVLINVHTRSEPDVLVEPDTPSDKRRDSTTSITCCNPEPDCWAVLDGGKRLGTSTTLSD